MDAVCQKAGAVPQLGSSVVLPEGGKGAERTFGPDRRGLMSVAFCGLLHAGPSTGSNAGALWVP